MTRDGRLVGWDTQCGAVFAVREDTGSSCSAKERIGLPWDFWCRFSFSCLLDSSSSLSSSLLSLPPLLFTGVTGGTKVVLWMGAGCPSTHLTSEASQLTGQVGGPNNNRPSMTPCQTPHMFGITCASITIWLKTILSISCRYMHMI